jgi:predicted peptidase
MKHHAILAILTGLLGLAMGAIAAETAPIEGLGEYRTLTFTSTTGSVLEYDLYLPATYTPEAKLPLLVMMHGMGPPNPVKRKKGWGVPLLKKNTAYNETNHAAIICEPVANAQWCRKCWDETGWKTGSHTHDLAAPPAGIKIVLELIPVLLRQYGCDTNRCYVSGLSNGGYATWDLLLYRPDLFAAAVPICGAGDTSKAARFATLPIWTFHGTADGTVPVAGTREMIAAIEAAGGKPKVTYFEDGKHAIWDQAWQTPGLIEWLFAQSRPPAKGSKP